MTLQEINRTKQTIFNLLAKNSLYEAILALQPFVNNTADYTIEEQYNRTKTSYDYLLQYLLAGVSDPRREEILSEITRDLYAITDKCVISLSANQSYDLFYTRSASLRAESLDSLYLRYLDAQNKSQMLLGVPEENRNNKAVFELRKEQERLAREMFNKIWCSYPLSSEDVATLKKINIEDKYAPDILLQSIIVSALFLGLSKFYDEQKLLLLLETYIVSTNMEVQTRALSAATIIMLLHPKRLQHSNAVFHLLEALDDVPHFKTDLTSIVNRLIRSRNTDNVTNMMRNDLMPDLMKMNPDILKKMKSRPLGTIDPAEFEGNPEWQEWLDKSGVSKKMEQLSQLQSDGDDVFISTFSHLKSFPFFNSIANWFIPFRSNHTMLEETFTGEDRKLLRVVKLAPFLCDSDKYSFCFSLTAVPKEQRSMMMHQFVEQKNDMSELKASKLPDGNAQARDAAVNSYIQSLYRFFKLFSRRGDFMSIFNTDINISDLPSVFFEKGWIANGTISVIAEFYLKHGFYADAIHYYKHLDGESEINVSQIEQKIGFAYQNLGQYDKAIEHYSRYELTNDNDLWNIQHLASCYRAVKKFDKALSYYQKALSIKPNNVSLNLNVGHCHLELCQYDDALHHYYKANYLDPEAPRVWRALAWTLFLKDDFKHSNTFYKKLVEANKATPQDLMNYGHVLLCQSNLEEAVDKYCQSANGGNEQLQTFISSFNSDVPILLKKELSHSMIHLIKEAVIKKINN